MVNLGIHDQCDEAMYQMGLNIEARDFDTFFSFFYRSKIILYFERFLIKFLILEREGFKGQSRTFLGIRGQFKDALNWSKIWTKFQNSSPKNWKTAKKTLG